MADRPMDEVMASLSEVPEKKRAIVAEHFDSTWA